MILRASQRLDALSCCRSPRIDIRRDRSRNDETYRLNLGIIEQRIYGFLIPVNHVENAVRQTSLLKQKGQFTSQRGVLFAWHKNEGGATRQRDGKHPHRDHGGEIERRDTGNNTQRLSNRVAIYIRADLF